MALATPCEFPEWWSHACGVCAAIVSKKPALICRSGRSQIRVSLRFPLMTNWVRAAIAISPAAVQFLAVLRKGVTGSHRVRRPGAG
jgi:hypothetical protein